MTNSKAHFWLILLCCCFPVQLLRAQAPVDKLIGSLQQAINQRDSSLLVPYLAPDFAIFTSTWPNSGQMLQSILAMGDSTCTVEPSGDKVGKLANGHTKLGLKYRFKGGSQVKTSTMVLNRDGRIEYIDYFDQLYGLFRDKPSELVASVPFEREKGRIMVKLRLNDSARELRFLFDTGADGMAITNALADSVGLKISRKQSTSVVGGNVKIQISSENTVHLGSVSVPRQNIAIFPNEHSNIDGIIGLNLANSYIIGVDFDNSVLNLYSLGSFAYPKKSKTIPVTVPSGVAVLDARLNVSGKEELEGQFFFDTGANFSLVCFSPFVRQNQLLVGGFKYDKVGNMSSFGHNTTIYSGQAASFSIGNNKLITKPMPVTLQASSGKGNWSPSADGSLGIEFSKQYNFIINLVEKEINFSTRIE
ncbi:MAG: retropepsin-like aspartic protease [Mangrovibacterium sp.]